jgi:integrase
VRESWDPKEGSIEPKTLTSKRTVPVPGILREYLLDHRLAADPADGRELVFARGDGRPFDAAVIYRRADKAWRRTELADLDREALEKLAGKAGIAEASEAEDADLIAAIMRDKTLRAPEQRLRLHQARHTYASFMIAANVNAKALSTYMGHSSIKVTFDLYGHMMPGNESEAAALLDAYLERANTQARIDALGGERP